MRIFYLSITLFVLSCNQNTHQKKSDTKMNEIYDGPIIDMHIHAFADGEPLFGLTHPTTLRGQTFKGVESGQELKKQVLERFKKYHIVKAVVTDGERWIDDAPDEILIAGAHKRIASLQKQFDEGKLRVIAEMAPFYAGIKASDSSQLPYFELAQKLDIPVGFHVLPGGPNAGIHIMPEMLGGMRAHNANPIQLEEVLVNFPKLKLYIMHGGWPYTEDVKALMYAHPNLYVDVAVINWILPKEECYKYIKDLVDAGFEKRIMYGSDQMVWPQTIDVGIETINSADFLTLEQKENIFYNNAAEFLGLSDEEIKKHKNN
ncbi:MAG: amidohydrolase family protein [Cytophagales bacterium]